VQSPPPFTQPLPFFFFHKLDWVAFMSRSWEGGTLGLFFLQPSVSFLVDPARVYRSVFPPLDQAPILWVGGGGGGGGCGRFSSLFMFFLSSYALPCFFFRQVLWSRLAPFFLSAHVIVAAFLRHILLFSPPVPFARLQCLIFSPDPIPAG